MFVARYVVVNGLFMVLRKEMKARDVSQTMIARELHTTQQGISKKMCGSGFRLEEAFRIRDAFFPDLTIDELFSDWH